MRQVKYFVASSLDNFISRLDGSVDWLFHDQDYGMAEFFASVDVAVMGRKTFEKMIELSPEQPLFPGMKHYVFSRTLDSTPYKEVEIVRGDVAGWLTRVRAHYGKHLWLVGGGSLVQEFLQHKLINEIGLAIHPRLLGKGIPLFTSPYPEMELELVKSKEYPTGLLQAFYRVRHA